MLKKKKQKKRKVATTLEYRKRYWLYELAVTQNLWYGAMAKIANIGPLTMVKWMIKHRVFTWCSGEIMERVQKIYKDDPDCIDFIVIPGNPAIKKNSNTTAKGMRLPNKNYAPYEELNVEYLKEYYSELYYDKSTPITLKFFFYKDTKRKTDISNLYEAPQDVMVKAGILEDDESEIVVSHHTDSRVIKTEKEFPRTEIYFYKATP